MIHLPDILVIAMRSTPPMFNKNTNNFCFRNCLNSIRYVLHLRWVMEHRPDRVSKKDCLVMRKRGDFFGAGNGGTVLERTPMNRCTAKANFSKCNVMKNSSDTKRNQQKLEFWTKNLNRTCFRYFLIFKLHTNIPFKCSVFRRLLFFSASETRTLSDVSSHQF